MRRSVTTMYLARGGTIGSNYLRQLKPSEYQSFVSELFAHSREFGLFYYLSDDAKRRHFGELARLHVEGLIKNSVIGQNFCAQGLAWSYFPHSLGVQARAGFHTPNETFSSDELLRKALANIIKLGTKEGGVSSGRIRQCLRTMARGTQGVSNFRPSAAKALYQRYAKDKVVWDMSCGFGGRLLGAMTAPVKKYIGTDPASLTMKGLVMMLDDLGELTTAEIELHQMGSEDFVPKEPVDFCFTSPPYFDIERYSDEPTQSYIKFPNMDRWLNGFVYQTTMNCWKCLRRDGILAYNISEVLAEPFLNVCAKIGFRHIETLQLRLSGMPGRGKKTGVYKNGTFKHEPVLVFRKR
jgi:hypothetical protein